MKIRCECGKEVVQRSGDALFAYCMCDRFEEEKLGRKWTALYVHRCEHWTNGVYESNQKLNLMAA